MQCIPPYFPYANRFETGPHLRKTHTPVTPTSHVYPFYICTQLAK